MFGSNNKRKPADPKSSYGDRYPFGMPYLLVPHDTPNQTVFSTFDLPNRVDKNFDFVSGPIPLDAPMEGTANTGYGKPGGDR
jgi:hypothetical protein